MNSSSSQALIQFLPPGSRLEFLPQRLLSIDWKPCDEINPFLAELFFSHSVSDSFRDAKWSMGDPTPSPDL